jgi:hypothetical protein
LEDRSCSRRCDSVLGDIQVGEALIQDQTISQHHRRVCIQFAVTNIKLLKRRICAQNGADSHYSILFKRILGQIEGPEYGVAHNYEKTA